MPRRCAPVRGRRGRARLLFRQSVGWWRCLGGRWNRRGERACPQAGCRPGRCPAVQRVRRSIAHAQCGADLALAGASELADDLVEGEQLGRVIGAQLQLAREPRPCLSASDAGEVGRGVGDHDAGDHGGLTRPLPVAVVLAALIMLAKASCWAFTKVSANCDQDVKTCFQASSTGANASKPAEMAGCSRCEPCSVYPLCCLPTRYRRPSPARAEATHRRRCRAPRRGPTRQATGGRGTRSAGCRT